MGVVISQGRIIAASVQFPLAEPGEMRDHHLGTRHRAAIGLTKVTDALVVVVSEETGTISIAEHAHLKRNLSPADLDRELTQRLANTPIAPDPVEADPEAAIADETVAAAIEDAPPKQRKAKSTKQQTKPVSKTAEAP
jgi:hypothetical protein